MDEDGRRASLSQRPSLSPSVLGLALEKFKRGGGGDGASVAGSVSSYRSRRLSASSQVSFTSKKSTKSIRSTRTGGRSRRNLKGAENAEPEVIQVFDENGKEVTPKPLVSLRPTVMHERLLQAPPERFSQDSERVSTFSRTGYSISSSLGTITPEIDADDGLEKEPSDTARRSSIPVVPPELLPRTQRIEIVTKSIAPAPTEQELERSLTINLVESETLILINLRGDSVSNTYDTIKQVLERNARYKTLLEAKIGSDNYSDSSAQTSLSLRKCKETQFFSQPKQSEECQANSWDISDSYAGNVKEEKIDPLKADEDDGNDSEQSSDHRKSVADLVSAGYLEEASEPPPLLQGRRMSGNLSGSRRGSGYGGLPSRRDSGLGSIDPSRRGSGVGSVAASRKGSTTASISPSRRGSLAASTRRGSMEKQSISGSIMFNRRLSGRGSLVGSQRRSSIIPNTMQRAGGEGMLGAEELMTLTMFASRRVDINRLAGLVKALEIVERAVVQNTFHDKLLFYRDFKPREQKLLKPPVDSSSSSHGSQTKSASSSRSNSVVSEVLSGEQIHKLWDFQCDLTEGRNVSCMVWNKTSRDLLTVGYGEFEFGTQKGGLIAFWSLKNPRYPHATIPTPSDVTALDFSTNSPNLLAVGFYDGNVAVYDAKNYKERDPLMQTGATTGKHNDPVWKLQWIDASSDHGESLISISTDGRVSQWSLKKDLEFVNLMRLKKIMAHSKGAQPQPFISRHAAGLCFDFSPRDPSLYLVGTEEGLIHKCSRSYNEQYLQSYVGHTGPVFQVRWSTVLPYIFLSCSSDWSVRLWREEQESALLVFQTSNESVGDIRWSCKHSCVFGTVTDDGRLEIWDMAVTAMKPVISYPFSGTKLSCVLFSEDAPIVLAGGSTGAVSVFRLVGFDVVQNEIDELLKLKKAITSNVNTNLD